MARRGRELSTSSREEEERAGGEEEEEDGEIGSADLTLHILAKAQQRGVGKGGRSYEVVAADARSGGAALPSDQTAVESGAARNEEPSADVSGRPEATVEVTAVEEGELNLGGDEEQPTSGRKKRKRNKEKKRKEAVVIVLDMDDSKAQPDDAAAVKSPENVEESLAMRKLLRGPRYFDPPEEQGETCYNCGQIGHRAAECTEQPRLKPCYVCSNFGHEGYECPQKTECYECGKLGHLAKLCPNKRFRVRSGGGICLMCGRLGHDASACFGDYDPQDFKQVRCYVCKQAGHLCCVEIVDASPTPVSCFQCGDLGHSGAGCTRQDNDRGDKNGCYKCGQEGHFARECTMVNQRRHSWPAPWPVDNDQSWKLHRRYGDQDAVVTPTGKYACSQRSRHLERMLSSESGRHKRHHHPDHEDESGELSRGHRRHHHSKQAELERRTPKSAGSHRKRPHD